MPWKDTTPGYETDETRRLVPNEHAPVVEEGFRLRAGGVPIRQLRAFLAEHGIERSYRVATRRAASALRLSMRPLG